MGTSLTCCSFSIVSLILSRRSESLSCFSVYESVFMTLLIASPSAMVGGSETAYWRGIVKESPMMSNGIGIHLRMDGTVSGMHFKSSLFSMLFTVSSICSCVSSLC